MFQDISGFILHLPMPRKDCVQFIRPKVSWLRA